MSAEFIDTNILVYAHDVGMKGKSAVAVDLLARLATERRGALSTQVLAEFYNTATRNIGMHSEEAEEIIQDFMYWKIHRPAHSDIVNAIRLQRAHQLSWWDSMIVNSAIESGAKVLWSEDLNAGQRFGQMVIRNPFL
jgi:predicted nucleic acid-binding protein